MAWTSGFFNSNNGDRLYNSDQLSGMFKGLITDGVYESIGNKLAVQPNSGMTIHLNTGRGWFYDKWVENDALYTLTLEGSDVTLNRYAAVGVKVDINNSVRDAVPFVKYSNFATTPIKPTPERSAKVKEYILAYVYIKAGVNEITARDIEDTRANTELCGWVTGLIKQIDSNTLFEQYDAMFRDWLNSLSDYLDENAEAKLAVDVTELKNKNVKATATLTSGGWTNNAQTVTVEGVTADNIVMVVADSDIYSSKGCKAVAQSTNSITFNCDTVPSVDIPVTVIIYNL